eukprot:TRINITY_DN8094_c0_g1_i1.p1 TRINITY_DN8094_c0_g1~~TRINITY_DN8094_c0_g1_i1.p1  ORF type:complete len:198 (+),score=45.64 TRINITY_DN8094_c0_g1_i1:213-806(+)
MKAHASVFLGCTGVAEEQTLAAHDVFRAYTEMVEEILQGFCTSRGFASGEELLLALQADMKGRSLSKCRGGYIRSLLSDGTYEGFVRIMLDYAGATAQTTPGGEPSTEAVPVAGQAGPFAGWSVEEATVLGGAGLLPAFPRPGETAWGYLPDEAGGGQWLAATVQHVAEDGSGVVVVWQHDGSANMLPPEYVQRGGA